MNSGPIMRHRDNPQEYCNRVTKLIENKDNQWQDVWKVGINELFEGPSYSITSVNSLLKVIEKAFKERMYSIRGQAFECWQLFITKVEEHSATSNPEKLLNVILIPLCASNHSTKNVLVAKLNTWLTLLNTKVLSKSISREKVVPNLLKILYGPHSLATACTFEDLTEICATLYSVLIKKYLKYDDSDLVLSYLEKAIPAASHDVNSRIIGQQTWTDVIEYISEDKWPSKKLDHLMKTLENLISIDKGKNYPFLYSLLSILVCEYDSLPVDSYIRHLGLITRCLFSSTPNYSDLTSILDYLVKRCHPKEHLLFNKINKILTEFLDEYECNLHIYWTAVVSCFCKWNKRSADYENWDWILLFPVKHLHDKWNQTIQESLQNCFDNVSSVVDHNILVRDLAFKLNSFLNISDTVPISILNAVICLCRTMLQKTKPSNVSRVKELLLTIYGNRPAQTPGDDPNKSFAPKYVTCLIYFLESYPDYADDFAPIIRSYSQLVNLNKDTKKFPIVQLMSKYTNKNNEDSENIVPVLKETNGITTPGKSKMRSSFLARLSSADKRNSNAETPFATNITNSPKSSISTPRSSQVPRNEDEVQFIAITSRTKNSPMTEHQKEMAKEKSYIPALYEDLSQSQSQSQHTDSMTTLPSKKVPTVVTPCPDFGEENANLPATNADSADEVPASFNFRDVITKVKTPHRPLVKKSLFSNHSSAPPLDHNDNTAVVPVPPKDTPIAANIENIIYLSDEELPMSARKPTKRKSLRIESNVIVESEQPKRSKVESKTEALEQPNKIQQQKNNDPTMSISSVARGRGRPSKRSSVQCKERKLSDSDVEVVNVTECESQNIFVRKPVAISSSPVPSLMDVKNSPALPSSRKRSLRRSKTKTPPPVVRSPINMRKRKNSLPLTPSSSKKVASLPPVVTPNQEDTATEESKIDEKQEKIQQEVKNSCEPASHSSKQDSEECSTASIVTVISAETPHSTESGRQADISQTPQSTDSVVIIEEGICEVITIDSCTELQSDDASSPVKPITPIIKKKTETVDPQEESTLIESTQSQSDANNMMSNAQSETAVAQTEKVPETRSIEVSLDLEVSQIEDNANNCVVEELPASSETPAEETNKESQVAEAAANEIIEKQSNSEEEQSGQVPKDKETSSPTTEASAEIRRGGDSQTETVIVANENVKTDNLGTSPMTSYSRTSHIMNMVFASQPNLTKPKGRVGRPPIHRHPTTPASPATTNTSNGTLAKTFGNTRALKMLQANGHVESPAKPSPSKNLCISEKMEKFKYTPKECTSPGILKRPNTNGTVSPKSPKSVNFAEQLTNTREYQVDENLSDSWSTSDQYGNNLLSDEEGTSQDTLYPVLHNCNDDIKHIAERLNMNKQQLDTFRRMGIETVGQLASVSTIVGKSIPVGDNRVQRLRSALKAYDNDRKLKGLRTPSVRRKIVYKSQNKQLEVSSIIEILDDTEESVTETESELEANPTANQLAQVRQPSIIITKLPPDVLCSQFAKSDQCSPTKAIPNTLSPSSPPKTPKDALTLSPSRLTRSQLSPLKSTSQSSPLKSNSQTSSQKSMETVPSSPIRFTRSLLSSPLKSVEVSSLLPCVSVTQSESSPTGVSGTASSSPPTKVVIADEILPGKTVCLRDAVKAFFLRDTGGRVVPVEVPISPAEERTEKATLIEAPLTSDVVDAQLPEASQQPELVDFQKSSKKTDDDTQPTDAPVAAVEESSTQQDANDDADFICTNDEIILNNNLNSRSYPKLTKAKKSMALLRTPSKNDFTADLQRTLSPEIVTVEMNETSITASTQESLGAKELEASNSNNVSLAEEQHSMSIFSPDITKEGCVVEEYASYSLIEGSAGVSCVSQEEGSTTTFSRLGSRVELRVEEDDVVAARSQTKERWACGMFVETLKYVKNGIERMKADGIADHQVDKEAQLLFDSLKRFYK